MFPNIRFITLGGLVFWDTIDTKNGWKLQRNILTGHYRILDPNNYRWDWDTSESRIREAFAMIK